MNLVWFEITNQLYSLLSPAEPGENVFQLIPRHARLKQLTTTSGHIMLSTHNHTNFLVKVNSREERGDRGVI